MEKSADKPGTSPDSSSFSTYFPTCLGCLEHLGIELSSSKVEEEDQGELYGVSYSHPLPLSHIYDREPRGELQPSLIQLPSAANGRPPCGT